MIRRLFDIFLHSESCRASSKLGTALKSLISPNAQIELQRTSSLESNMVRSKLGTALGSLITPRAQAVLRRTSVEGSFRALSRLGTAVGFFSLPIDLLALHGI